MTTEPIDLPVLLPPEPRDAIGSALRDAFRPHEQNGVNEPLWSALIERLH